MDQTQAADVSNIIARLQEFVYPRRPRVKENFVDYDPLRHGGVPFTRFLKSVAALESGVSESEIEAVALHFERPDGDIDYVQFCASIDVIFGPNKIDSDPTTQIPPSGFSAPTLFDGEVHDDKIHHVLHRLSLLCKTRGVVLKYCYHDFDRGDSASILVHRRCGKVTVANFRRAFPFKTEFSPDEMCLILQRYVITDDITDDAALVNYQALHDDVTDRAGLVTMQELPRSDFHPPDLSQVRWTKEDYNVVERIQARIVERRLRPRDYFQDFDPLRKGYCTKGQALTVFSVMDIKISQEEFDELCTLYCRVGDLMFHYDAFQEKADAAFATKGLEMAPMANTQMPSPEDTLATRKNSIKTGHGQASNMAQSVGSETDCIHLCELLEAKLKARMNDLRIPFKQFFEDFDHCKQGHITRCQFLRVLTGMNFALSQQEMNLLAAKFSDTTMSFSS